VPIFAHMTESISTVSSITSMAPSLSLGAISPVMTNLLVGLFLLVSIVMILLVLIQRPQGGGLSGAFGAGGGGGGAGQTAFGTKTGDVLTWATIGIFVCFLVFAIVLNFATRPVTASPTETLINAPAGTNSAPASNETTDLSGSPLDALEDLAGDGASDEETNIDETIDEDVVEETPAGEPVPEPGQDGSETSTDLPVGDE